MIKICLRQTRTNYVTHGLFQRLLGSTKVRRGALWIIVMIVVFSALHTMDNTVYTEYRPPVTYLEDTAHLKKIIFWNDYFGSKDHSFGVGQQPFVSAGCPVTSCYVTHDRDLFPMAALDAVIWHGRSRDISLPAVRARKTQYVFLLREPPKHLWVDLRRYRGVFNLTMTYRRDSDVLAPYGWFEPRKQPLKTPSGTTTNYAEGKTKMAAWFVSNCVTDSEREILVSELQQHISVDVYGSCGSLSCPLDKFEECREMVQKHYRFYLSFENSLCKDYVTEKFFGMAKHNVIPVVYGLGPYDVIAPNHSYINVLDFASVKDLADHLTYLTKNDTAYNEYFRWKEKYEVHMDIKKGMCNLCERLHQKHPDRDQDIYEWFVKDKCLEAWNEEFEHLTPSYQGFYYSLTQLVLKVLSQIRILYQQFS